jgi:serine/threonine protein kinase
VTLRLKACPTYYEGPVGAGGMGEVYRARDSRLGRTVAVKVVRGEYTERFEREARAISALNLSDLELCVAQDKIVMLLAESNWNIWMTELSVRQ